MSRATQQVIRLNAADNVVVAQDAIAIGTRIEAEKLTCGDEISAGHKIATAAIKTGDPVRKYNQIIGFASRDIAVGDHVHTHNCKMADFARDYAFGEDVSDTDFVPEAECATFEGILREGGKVGTRNYIAVLTTVNCSATVARHIADAFRGDALADYPNVDGVAAFVHGTGCGMAFAYWD